MVAVVVWIVVGCGGVGCWFDDEIGHAFRESVYRELSVFD